MPVISCPAGIQYKYGSDIWTYLDADSYELTSEQGACYVGYQVDFTAILREYLVDCDRDLNGHCITPWFVRGYGDKLITGQLTVNSQRRVAVPPLAVDPSTPKIENLDGSITELAAWRGSYRIAMRGATATNAFVEVTRSTDFYIPSSSTAGYYDLGNGTYKRYNGRLFLDGSVVTTKYTPLNPEPLTCIKACIFTAYKNGQQVYRQQQASCPLVQCVSAQQCPPNTCDVLCGNTICCYNSEGISVFNYPNS